MDELCEIICITCPKGCKAKVWEEEGRVKVKGEICKKGQEYLQQEFLDPRRILTTTVVVENSHIKRLPVRTVEAIPKKDLLRAMEKINRVKVNPPIKMGDIIISNLLNTGVDVIASDDLAV
jgi:CxxC motif-containing protein